MVRTPEPDSVIVDPVRQVPELLAAASGRGPAMCPPAEDCEVPGQLARLAGPRRAPGSAQI